MDLSKRVQLGGFELSYGEFGAPDGRPVFYFHGWPGSRLEAARAERAALDRRLRIVAIDRPGIGRSQFQPGRQLINWPEVVAQLADHLGWEKFSVFGVSGGGPYALACAARSGDRLDRIGVCSGIPHYNWLRADRSASLSFRLGLRLADRSPAIARALLGLARLTVKSVGRFDFLRPVQFLLRPHDRAPLKRREVRRLIERTIRESFSGSTGGLLHDIRLLTSPWGFDLHDLSVPVRWWHGTRDHLCPIEAVRSVASDSPSITVEEFGSEGHYSLPLLEIGHILDYFAGH